MPTKRLKSFFLTLMFLSIMIFTNLNTYNLSNDDNLYSQFINRSESNIEFPIISIQSNSAEYSGVGIHQNVTEFGRGIFQENGLNLSKSGNASIIVPENWEANKIRFNITDIYEYDRLWINDTFDFGYDSTSWTNYTTSSDPELAEFGWLDEPLDSNDSIYLKFIANASNNWQNTDSYWNYTFNFDRNEIPFEDWIIDFNYRLITNDTDWIVNRDAPGGTSLYCSIGLNGVETAFKLVSLRNDIENDTWYSDIIVPFNPELYGFNPPGNISVRFGVAFGNGLFSPAANISIYFDNITLKMSSIPKPSQIALNLTDNEHGTTVEISDLGDPGTGSSSFNDTWLGTAGGSEYNFSFSSNSSGLVYIDTDIFINATSSTFTTTDLGLQGSKFKVGNETRAEWTMYFGVSIPGTYEIDYYFNVSKPVNWNITQVIDPYGNDKINDVLPTSGPGNSTLIIPNSIAINGRWKFIAEAPNYVLNATIWKWAISTWEKNTSFEISDTMKINATINDQLIPDLTQTNASLLVFYPNGTTWKQVSQNKSPDSSGYVEFDTFTLGAKNASAGKYTVNIRWNGGNASQVGLIVLNFDVTHDTTLDRAEDQDALVTPIFTGDTVLIKVNYTDINEEEGIIGATVNYTIDNATEIKGSMQYYGGGIYIEEIDTAGWQYGLYNVSVSANKTYYKSQYKQDLIQLEVTQTTNLTSPQIGGLFVPWGTNVTIDVNYNDSLNQGITNATIKCDWDLGYYTIQEIGSGHYQIILNTSIKPIGIYPIKINASKTGHVNQEIYISINIRNIYTNLTFIQPSPVGIDRNVTVQIKYGDIDNGTLISGANITVSSDLGAQYWSLNNFSYQEISLGTYNLTFNTSVFGGGGTYVIYVTANKSNYANATTPISIFVSDRSTTLTSPQIGGLFVPWGKNITIDVNYNESLGLGISNATVKCDWDAGYYIIQEMGSGQYRIILNTTVKTIGTYTLKINASKLKYIGQEIFISINIRNIYTNITYVQPSPIGIDRNVTIQLTYGDIDNGTLISGANITVSSDFDAQYWPLNNFSYQEISPGTYNLTFNTSVFGGGGTYVIYVTANKSNYANATTPISIFVGDRTSTLTSPQIGGLFVPSGRNVTIDVYYNESLGPGISNATVKCNWNSGYYTIQEVGFGQYNITLNTTIKTIGTYTLKINASKAKYETKEIFISINIRNIYTNLTYIQPSPVGIDRNITIQLEYGDIDNGTLISNANITVSFELGAQYWPLNNYSYFEISPSGTYNLTFNTSIFGGGGTYVIYVTAYKANYANATNPISIFVVDRSTTLTSPQVGGVFVPWGRNETIEIFYNETSTQGISNATIQCNWDLGYYTIQEVGSGKYTITLNSTSKTIGTYTLKINASKSKYETREIYISINIHNIFTNLSYIQPDPVEFRSNISILISYGDTDNNTLISDANLSVSFEFGAQYWSLSNYSYFEISSSGIYNLTFNTSIFGRVGTFLIYITANKSNYANASIPISIFIELIDATLILEDLDDTYLKQNITLKLYYNDSSGKPIENANITYSEDSLGAGGFNYNSSGFYYLNLNTSNLGIGVYYIFVKANGSNLGYKIKTDTFLLKIFNIPTILTAEYNILNVTPGSSFTIRVTFEVDNSSTGWIEFIKNATVTYYWVRGEGNLTDNLDGTYEFTMDAPMTTKTYDITISAFKENYTALNIIIYLVVQLPPQEPGKEQPPLFFPPEDIRPLLAMIIIPMVGAIAGLSVYMAWYRHFRYPVIVRRMRKAIKNIKKKKTVKPFEVGSRTDLISGLVEKDFEKFQNEILIPLTGKKKGFGKMEKKAGKKK